jgi:hypothetical protein
MVSTASPQAAAPKMVELSFIIVHASSSYAWAQYGYFKHSHLMNINGDKMSDSGWFLVGFGVSGCLTHD